MRLVLYNIRYGTGTGIKYHLPLPFSGNFRNSVENFSTIKKFIKGLSPDVVALVETDGGSYRQKGLSQPKAIASSMRGKSAFQVKYRDSVAKLPILRSQGNALVSRECPLKVESHDLGRGIKRKALEVTFRDFSVLLVHLSLGQSSRKHQIDELTKISSNRKKPLVVAGDYNALKGPKELDPLKKEGFYTANFDGNPTFPCRRPKRELDFILLSQELILDDFFIPRTNLSDHLPLVCDFRIPGKKGRKNHG